MKYGMIAALFMGVMGLLWPPASLALSPSQVAVIFNRAVPESEALADAYMKGRGIPSSQKIPLTLPVSEIIDRTTYERRLAEPLRAYLHGMPHVRCLVTIYGVPLKIVDHGLTPFEAAQGQGIMGEIATLERDGSPKAQADLATTRKRWTAMKRARDKNASVDSELMLVKREGVPTSFWVPNPLFIARRRSGPKGDRGDVLLVSRLDGPDPSVVRRIMADSLAVESLGLQGTAYFDARWAFSKKKGVKGYALYDRSIHRSARRLSALGFLPVVTDEAAGLFPPGSCPQAALYCGWYSLATYVDAFTWQRGAVGYHIASSEMTTLKNPESRIWCLKMLQKGVAATIGPVGEPYVQSFPFPEVFFPLLAEGRFTLVECYAASLPVLSWKMVLVGDPLYRPFYAKPSPWVPSGVDTPVP